MAQCVFVILNYLDKDHIAKQLAGVSKEELREIFQNGKDNSKHLDILTGHR